MIIISTYTIVLYHVLYRNIYQVVVIIVLGI